MECCLTEQQAIKSGFFPASSSSLDTIETTGTFPATYHAHCVGKDPEEYKASLETYQHLDLHSQTSRADLLENCRSFAWFAVEPTSRKVKVISNACRLRWCPLCSRAKAAAVTFSVATWLKSCAAPKILTVTLKHSTAPLGHRINHLYQGFRKLRKTKLFKSSCRGGIWFFQIKRSSISGCWHPHIHCIIDSDFMPHAALSRLWCEITKGSTIVDIRTIFNVDKISQYVARYTSRPATMKNLNLDDRLEVFLALHGRRLCGAFGTAKGVNLKGDQPPEDGTWFRLATWQNAIKRSGKEDLGYVLFDCWRCDKPLPDTYDLSGLSNNLRFGPSSLLAELNLDDY